MPSIGSKGTQVEHIQLALTRAGYPVGGIDGDFGPATEAAVRDFQRSQGLPPDGIAGTRTQVALAPYLRGYRRHRVRQGDTLFLLSQRYSTDLGAIQTANPGLDPRNLQVGQVITIPLGFPLVPTNVRYSSQLTQYIVEGLTMRYPFLSAGSLGRSVIGRPIPYLRIGQGSTQAFYNAAFHANEWITTPVLLKFMEQYAAAYASGGKVGGVPASELYDKATLFLAPLINPDGVDLVNGVLNSGRFYDEAVAMSAFYPGIPFPNGWKANISGVDLNLQFPANWEMARNVKFAQGYTRPGPRDYVGTGPLTAPESLAVFNFTLARDFSIILAYHTQGEVIYWKYLDFEPAESRRIAYYFGEVSGYTVEETPYASGFAGYKDWFIEEYNRPGYTIEVGRGVNPLPLSQFDQIYRDNIGILTGAITQI